jgi:hypothetical protein
MNYTLLPSRRRGITDFCMVYGIGKYKDNMYGRGKWQKHRISPNIYNM